MSARAEKYPIYTALLVHFGKQHWWPAKTTFDILAGAVLTQNTAWRNVEKVIETFHLHAITSAESLLQLPYETLQNYIRPAGFFHAKSQTLRDLSEWYIHYDSDPTSHTRSTSELRQQLLSIKGIGSETADAILLYALHRVISVADAYTVRVGIRCGALQNSARYQAAAEWLKLLAPYTLLDQQELHALLVALGKSHCRKRFPLCHTCPLQSHCKSAQIELEQSV